MRKPNPIINPYLFQLLKALIRMSLNKGNYMLPLSQAQWNEYCDTHHAYSSETMPKIMRDTAKSLVRLDKATLDLLCQIFAHEPYGYQSWTHFVKTESNVSVATLFIDKRFFDLQATQQDAINQAVEHRIMAIKGLVALPGLYEEPDNADFEASEQAKNNSIAFTKAFSRKFSQPEIVERRVRAWYMIENAITAQKMSDPDAPPSLYKVQEQVSIQEWANIRYVIAILSTLYSEYIEGNIYPSALNYDIKEFVEIWHKRVLQPYIAKPEDGHWLVVRKMDTLAEFYKDIPSTIH
jgi:hypothetical protein